MSRSMRWPLRSSLLLTCAAVAVLLLAAPTGAIAGNGSLLSDGVVIDPGAGLAYAMSPSGGVDAIELATGDLRWNSTAAAKPLHLTDGLLICQADAVDVGSLDLVALDTSRAGSRLHGMTMTLGENVWGGIDDRPDRSFRCHVGGDPSRLTVSWRDSRLTDDRFSTRAPAFAGQDAPVIATAHNGAATLTGAAVVDLVAGRAAPMDPAQIATGALAAAPMTVGTHLAGIQGRQLLSADGGHVLASIRSGQPGEWDKYQWLIYTTSGDMVGQVSRHTAMAPFTVTGTTLVFVDGEYSVVRDGVQLDEPLKLRAIDLVSGTETWSRALRDTAFRGPFKP